MALDQTLIDEIQEINTDFAENRDWFPANTAANLAKLLTFIHAYEGALALRASHMSRGGQAEELRFNMEVMEDRLVELQKIYTREAAKQSTSKKGGFRQHQLERNHERWDA